jgi:4'-phosphopantetheinyl transferase
MLHPALRQSLDLPFDLRVQCWSAHLDSLPTADLAALFSLLNENEQRRVSAYHLPRDQQRYAATRGLLRVLLAEALNDLPAEIAFTYGAHGKPALDPVRHGTTNLQFNLSHSDGWAMFAFAECAVGIDLENGAHLSRGHELAALAARVLSPAELTAWQTFSDQPGRHTAFLRAWVRKEACAKAAGYGIAADVRNVEAGVESSTGLIVVEFQAEDTSSGLTSRWMVHDLSAPEGYLAAVALAAAT